MKASIHFDLETAEDFALFGRVFAQAGGFGEEVSSVVTPAAPAKPVEIASAAKPERAAKPVKADKPAEEKQPDPSTADAKVEEAAIEAETVDKALVAKELRAFIQKKGESGPKSALAVLKEFGASKFDELKGEDYSKFLTALAKAA